MVQLNEAEAVQRLKQGDRSAFADLYDLYAEPAIRTAYLITRCQSAAEDAVQEAFVQVLRCVSDLRNVASFRPWFYRILVNTAKRLARRGPMHALPLDLGNHDHADATVPTPDEVALSSEEVKRLRAGIGELNDTHRVPIYLRYFTGLSEQEIAQSLGLPQGTVKSRLHNARKMLHRRLEGVTKTPLIMGAEGVTER